ncbi:hypothetical protein D3C72_1657980 [compost metagenome]
MNAAEINNISTGGSDLCDESVEIFLAASDALVEHFTQPALPYLRHCSVGQALTVGVLVVNDGYFFRVQSVDDEVPCDHALLIITSTHAKDV